MSRFFSLLALCLLLSLPAAAEDGAAADAAAAPVAAVESTEPPAAEPPAAPEAMAAKPADDFIRFVESQQDPAKASADAIDASGSVMIEMDGERSYYSGRDLIGLQQAAKEKTSGFTIRDFKETGRLENDRTISVTYSYGYSATTDGIETSATLEACETYEKISGGWRLLSGAYWHKMAK